MKRAGRRFLYALGALALGVGFFVWDMIRRAEAAIAAQEGLIPGEIAALRAAQKPSGFSWLDYSEALGMAPESVHFRRLLENGNLYPYESASFPFEGAEEVFVSQNVHRRGVVPTPDGALISLALGQELLRAGGIFRARRRLVREDHAIEDWKDLLEQHDFSARDLERYARLVDHLRRSRPGLGEALRAEGLMDRIRVIRVLRSRSDDEGTLYEGPGWKSMFLWRLFIAQQVTALERMYRDLEQVEHRPLETRWHKAREICTAPDLPNVRLRTDEIPALFGSEAEILSRWTLLRVALGIAWFRAERGRLPATLADLVPRYLESVPLDPKGGQPLKYDGEGLEPSGMAREFTRWHFFNRP